MGLFGAGQEPRTADDIKAGQTRAKLDDANASTPCGRSLTLAAVQVSPADAEAYPVLTGPA